MSLIIDILKKLEGKTKRPKVHPALLKKTSEIQDKKRYIFLAFSILFALSALAAYIVSDKILSRAVQPDVSIENLVASVERREPARKQAEPSPKELPPEEMPEEAPEPTIVKEVQPVALTERKEEEPQAVEVDVEEKPTPKPVKVSETTGVEKIVSDMVAEPPEAVPQQAPEPEPQPEPKEEKPPPKPEPRPALELKPETRPSVPQRAKPQPKGSFAKLVYLADRSFREGNLAESMKYYEQAFSIKEDRKVANNLIVIYTRLGLYDKARDLILKLKDENLAYAYLVELSRSGEYEKAVQEGRRLKDLDRRGKVYFALGYAHEMQGDLEMALKNYKAAYRKNPGDPYIAVNYARLLEATGDLREAFKVYSSLNFASLDPRLKSLVEGRLNYLRSLGF